MKPLTLLTSTGGSTSDASRTINQELMVYQWGKASPFALRDMHTHSARSVLEFISATLRRPKFGFWMRIAVPYSQISALVSKLEEFTKAVPQSGPFLYKFTVASSAVEVAPALFTPNRYALDPSYKLDYEVDIKDKLKIILNIEDAALQESSVQLSASLKLSESSEKTLEQLGVYKPDVTDAVVAALPLYTSYNSLANTLTLRTRNSEQFTRANLLSKRVTELARDLTSIFTESIQKVEAAAADALKKDASEESQISTKSMIRSAVSKFYEALLPVSRYAFDLQLPEYTPINLAQYKYDTMYSSFTVMAEQISTLLGKIDTLKQNSIDSDTKVTSLFIRLFPNMVPLVYPAQQFSTQIVSGSKILQITQPRNNTSITLRGCIALNTLDTQWLDFYKTVFDYWVDVLKNPGFDLIFGEYRIPKCYLAAPPVLVNNLNEVETFDLNIISSTITAEEISSTTVRA